MLIIGHWLSCNLGDKYQPYIVYETVIKNNQNVQCVNFSSDNGNPMYFDEIKIIAPDEIAEGFHTAIITTGSMDSFRAYVPWVAKLIEKYPSSKFIFWGGFERGYSKLEEFCESLSFLRQKNVFYFARTEMDFLLYKDIVIDCSRGKYAGDPICNWVEKSKLNKPTLNPLSPNGVIIIPSLFCFEYESHILWEKICERGNFILCIDTYTDGFIKNKYPNVVICNNPLNVIDYLKDAAHVISGRLHGAVLSASLGIPTTLIQIDSPKKGLGSYKYEAFGDICRLLHPEETTIEEIFTIPKIKTLSVENMIETTKETLKNL